MKLLPIILIATGCLLLIIGIIGIFLFIHVVCDSPEDIKNMDVGDELTVYGEISNKPVDFDDNGYDDASSTWLWKRYNYTFAEGGYFYSPEKLDVEPGESYVIDLSYKRAEWTIPEGPAIKGSEESSVSGTFTYRLPGIGVAILGLGVLGTGVFLIGMDKKRESEQGKERKRKKDAIDKQMELLEKEIGMALTSTGPGPGIQYQPPPGQLPGQARPPGPPTQQPPPFQQQQMPPQGPPLQQRQMPPQQPFPGQMPPQGQPPQQY